jgi:hypothetical protein
MALAEVAKAQKHLLYKLSDELVDGKITMREFIHGVMCLPIPAVVASVLFTQEHKGESDD